MQEEDVALWPRTASFTVRTPEPWNQAKPKSCDRSGRLQAAATEVSMFGLAVKFLQGFVNGLSAGHPYFE